MHLKPRFTLVFASVINAAVHKQKFTKTVNNRCQSKRSMQSDVQLILVGR